MAFTAFNLTYFGLTLPTLFGVRNRLSTGRNNESESPSKNQKSFTKISFPRIEAQLQSPGNILPTDSRDYDIISYIDFYKVEPYEIDRYELHT